MSTILYPEYFDSEVSRRKGRRVSKGVSLRNPDSGDILKIAKSLGYKASIESKNHPRFWYRKRGRVIVEAEESKSLILKKMCEYVSSSNIKRT